MSMLIVLDPRGIDLAFPAEFERRSVGSYQVPQPNSDYQIVSSLANLKTMILRHMQNTSFSSLGCCEIDNRIVR